MTQRHCPAETKQRAEKAIADLEAFYDTIRNCTPFGRRQEMARFSSLRFAMVGISGSDSYITQKLTSLDVLLKQLSMVRPPSSFNENSVTVQGMGLVSSIRAQLHSNGLVDHYSRPAL